MLIITLYLFAIPFSQVLTEGRLPQLPQDLGRILLFNILIPLVLLYDTLSNTTRRVTDVLDEQSAGLIARRSEQVNA